MSSVISNEFRGIKRKLLQKARDPETRAAVNNLIMVTSSLPGEGKTFTSINLAMSLAAERGLQVLLIDADVIRPSVGNMFKSPPQEGLTDLLTGKAARFRRLVPLRGNSQSCGDFCRQRPRRQPGTDLQREDGRSVQGIVERAIRTESSLSIRHRFSHRRSPPPWPAMSII